MQWVWFPTLIGWGVKALILRYGGMRLYRSGIPFFLGLLVGERELGDTFIGQGWLVQLPGGIMEEKRLSCRHRENAR
jgi:hypothetical protein